MCGIREDKQRRQSSFRPREPEMSDWALGDWMVIRALLILADWRLFLTIGGFQYHKSPRGSILISNGLRQRNPPNEIWALTRAGAERPWRLVRGESGMREDANTKARKAPLLQTCPHPGTQSRKRTRALRHHNSFEKDYRAKNTSAAAGNFILMSEKQNTNKTKQQCSGKTQSDLAHTHSHTFKYSHT